MIEKGRTKQEVTDEDKIEIDGVPAIDRLDAMSVKSSTAVKVCDFNVNEYHQANMFLRIQ